MRRRLRKHNKGDPELNIIPLMNVMVILIPYLLTTAIFSQVAILELKLPQVSQGPATDQVPNNEPPPLQLNVVIQKDAISITDNRKGELTRIVKKGGKFDLEKLSNSLLTIKDRLKGLGQEKRDLNLLAEPTIDYETLVQVMDAVRVTTVQSGGQAVALDLFPEISLGDAPPSSTGTTEP
jgi:biopolymer transport protein ExbD